jgi:hypothetical protein
MDERGIQSVHVAPFSHVLRFTRHGLEQIADQPDRLFRRGSGMDEMWC